MKEILKIIALGSLMIGGLVTAGSGEIMKHQKKKQGSPPEVHEQLKNIPQKLKDQASIIVSGIYQTGRGPCQWLPDGTRRWALTTGFNLTGAYKGQVQFNYIGISFLEAPLSSKVISTEELLIGEQYLLYP